MKQITLGRLLHCINLFDELSLTSTWHQRFWKPRLIFAAQRGNLATMHSAWIWCQCGRGAEEKDRATVDARNGMDKVVGQLLQRKKANVNLANCYSRTPLSWGLENGHNAVVRLLIKKTKGGIVQTCRNVYIRCRNKVGCRNFTSIPLSCTNIDASNNRSIAWKCILNYPLPLELRYFYY